MCFLYQHSDIERNLSEMLSSSVPVASGRLLISFLGMHMFVILLIKLVVHPEPRILYPSSRKCHQQWHYR